jgi:hypothetical protein
MPLIPTQIYLSDEQRRKLDARCWREGKSLSAIVRDAIDAYLEPTRADYQEILDETFGSNPNFEVPPRSEWGR